MTRYKCNNCNEETDYVSFTEERREWGTADIEQAINNEYFDHDHDDSEQDSCTYECPNCHTNLGYDIDSVLEKLTEITDEDTPVVEETIVGETLKVGDRVTIRNDLSSDNGVEVYGLRVNVDMLKFCGVSFLITKVINHSNRSPQYQLNINNSDWFWTSKMFESSIIKDMSFTNNDFSVHIINSEILIDDLNENVIGFPIDKLDYLLKTHKDIQAISDGEDSINLNGKHNKLIELLEKVKNAI